MLYFLKGIFVVKIFQTNLYNPIRNAYLSNINNNSITGSVLHFEGNKDNPPKIADLSEDIFVTKIPKLAQPKVIGKIELPEQAPIVRGKKMAKYSYLYKTSNASDDVCENLENMWLDFEKRMQKKNNIYDYQRKKALPKKVQEIDILRELDNVVLPYNNINMRNTRLVANAINSDTRFQEMFSLHAAMRLIDRFVDFKSNKSIDEQSSNILNKLEEFLQQYYNCGKIRCNKYEMNTLEDKMGIISLRIVLYPEYAHNYEIREIFGSNNLKIGLCKRDIQDENDEINKYKPLICTIFSNTEYKNIENSD